VEHNLPFPAQSQAGFIKCPFDLGIFNNGMVNCKLDHSMTAHEPGYLFNRFRLSTATTALFQELLWIIQGNLITTVPLMVLHRYTNSAALHYSK